MSSISEALKALTTAKFLDEKTRFSKNAETWIETAEKILKQCPGKGKAREKPLISLDISALLTGEKFVARENYIAVSGLSGKQYTQQLRGAWAHISLIQDAGLPKLTIQLVAKAMGAEELVPWAESLISGYEKAKSIIRDEQPSCIIAAFELVKPGAKETYPANIQLIRQIKECMAVQAKEIKKDPKYTETVNKSVSVRKSNRLSAPFVPDAFSIEIEPPSSRSSSPVGEPEKPKSKRIFILPVVPFYETKNFEILVNRLKT